MNKKDSNPTERLIQVSHIATGHICLALLLAVQILVYDAWELITPEAIVWRWLIAGGLFVAATGAGYAARKNNPVAPDNLLWWLITVDILVASFSVYTQRGMAARAVALYAVPIIVSALFNRATAIFATAALSVVAYVIAAASYFVLNFNEGYKVELYGEVSFYALFFLMLSIFVWTVARPKQ